MRWDSKDVNDYRIKKAGKWCAIDEIMERFPDLAGVYVFADRNHQVKYVGKAGAGRLRLEAWHAVSQRNKDYGATLARYFVTNSDKMARSLEKAWIEKYQPVNNDRG